MDEVKPPRISQRRAGLLSLALGMSAVASSQVPISAQEVTTTVVSAPTTVAASTTTTPSAVVTVVPTTTVPTSTSTTLAPSTVAPSTTTASSIAPSTTVPAPSTSTTLVPSTTSTTTPRAGLSISRTLSVGSKGPDVAELEKFLSGQKYDVGKIDDRFDWNTWQGVVAFQKVHELKRTGKVTPEFAAAMGTFALPTGLIPSGQLPRIEIDISRQVMFLYDETGLYRVIAVSTGANKKYCETGTSGKKVCGASRTPRGNYRIQRRISGWRVSELGRLYNPLYFTGGFAVHGSPSVPAGPASHGCVRITMSVAEWFPDKVKNGTPIYLYD